MKHWSAEFRPRSICNYGSDGDSGPSGDSGGGYTGDTGGDFFGSSDGGYYGTNDSGSFQGSDTGFQATGGDSWTGSETGAGQFAASDPGSYFGGGGGGGGGGGDLAGQLGISDISPSGDYSSYGYDYSGSPYADYGPGTGGGVDFTGSGMGFGYGPGAAGNMGIGGAMGPPGWATSDFGTYGTGGPTGTGFGQGAQSATIGGPQAYGSPSASAGINGFPGSQQFGDPQAAMIAAQEFGEQGKAGSNSWIGGPTTVQQGEALNPSLFGPEVTSPEVTRPSDDRTEVDPTTVFGPAVTANAGWFGPSQAQAASRGTDAEIIAMQNNPAVVQAVQSWMADPTQANQIVGPMMTGFEGPSPGAQHGFTGTSAQQGTMAFDSFAGKGDSLNQSGRADVQQTNPNMDQIDPMVQQAGYQQLAQEMNAQQAQQTPTVQQSGVPTVDPATMQQGYQQLAAEMNARQNQQDMMTAQEHGEQGKSGVFGVPSVDPATSKAGYDMLAQQMNEQLSNQNAPLTADMFDAQSRGEQGKGEQLAPWMQGERGPIEQQMETIGLRPGEDVISSLLPATLNVGREAAPIGLWGMQNDVPAGRPGGSPAGMPSVGPFGPGSGRPGGDTSGRPGLSITVGNNQYAAGRPGGPGYYQTGGAGIAPGAKGAEYGGAYGINSPGRPGTSAFGGDFRSQGGGTGWFFDPGTGQYFQAGGRR